MWKANSLGKTLILGKVEGRRRGRQKIRWLDGITDPMNKSLRNSRRWWRRGKPGMLWSVGSQRVGHNLVTEQQQQREHTYTCWFADERAPRGLGMNKAGYLGRDPALWKIPSAGFWGLCFHFLRQLPGVSASIQQAFFSPSQVPAPELGAENLWAFLRENEKGTPVMSMKPTLKTSLLT